MLFTVLHKTARFLTKFYILMMILVGLVHIEEASAKKKRTAESLRDAQASVHVQLNSLLGAYEEALNRVQNGFPFNQEIVDFFNKYHPERVEHFNTQQLWNDWVALLREKNNTSPVRMSYLTSLAEQCQKAGSVAAEPTELGKICTRINTFSAQIDERFSRVDLHESKTAGRFFVQESDEEFKQASGRRTRKFLTYGGLGSAGLWVWRNKGWLARRAAHLLWEHRGAIRRFFTRSRVGALLMLGNLGFSYATCEGSKQACMEQEVDENLKDLSNGRFSLHPPTDESYLATELLSGSCRLNLPELEGLTPWQKLYKTKEEYWKSRDLYLGGVRGGPEETPLERALRRNYPDDEIVEMMSKDSSFEYAFTSAIESCAGKPTQERISTIVTKFNESQKIPPQNEDLLDWFHRNVKNDTLRWEKNKIQSTNPNDQVLYWMVTRPTTLGWMRQNSSFASDVMSYCFEGKDRNLQAKMCTWYDIVSSH